MPCPYILLGRNVGYDPERHHRRSIRLPGRDYGVPGWYFVTICTFRRECLLGSVIGEGVDLSAFGHLVEVCWREIPQHFPSSKLDEFVVMPNHVHGIIVIAGEKGTACRAPTLESFAAPVSGSLTTIVRSFKSAATKAINEVNGTPGTTVWQRDYHERVIRNERELEATRRYIANNPAMWDRDEENPDL